ncbi:BREX-2 system adenine-specific DNA-methyltransferase PglX [Aporhodopirellula aestuarii]|uniref:site-specific DNA-methyltransferase (adenine-specific) n=1 Tax=Aporhodopirellula aestuarii TaxID=2950107 RepID=A0ABT0U3P1_9BACT|nr:BREX-2 system adenine-specific DNA-methyltransferase PglX [Aporhodopirellula aestuarii]MCM2371078.1 BREX-2 system adenine-specific DNA-methyltransferase PglX [Aporhodopirellula aestuarii]
MVDIKTLLPELKKLVTELSEDLLARSTASGEIDAGLREAYTQIEKGGRTADAFEVWREDYLDQVAVAWVLGCVFVRFMEDNHLIDECWLAGEGDRRKQAEDSHELYFREHPRESDREYFEHVFHEVGKIPACQDLFAEGKTPLWAVGPSGDAAMKLLAFWREIDTDSGHLKRTFDVEEGDTRFLGDLYQDLSERARKKYALLQTPVFVEEFILDRTLDPAIDEFGLDEVRMIDPTCGSGHFLLGGFARLFHLWVKREDNDIVAAQKALDGVWGVDINPFAVAIARFRLIVAALKACNIKTLRSAPAWKVHLATGDSLLFGTRWDRDGKKKGEQQFFSTDEESWAPEIYACEDKEAISEVLGQQYHVVVGNPPYIIVRDRSLNQAYRDRYSTCHRKFSLAAPFAERFFEVACSGATGMAGYVGTITSNAFMKREFGTKLIVNFFPTIDLTHVIDTSGAYIPGHGTPTVILFGRNRQSMGETIRGVLGIQGEPTTPDDPAHGQVWQSIISQIDTVGSGDQFSTVADLSRSVLARHPWSLEGGGAAELKMLIDNAPCDSLAHYCASIGFGSILGEDEAYSFPVECALPYCVPDTHIRPFVEGENLRDWTYSWETRVLFPYDSSISLLPVEEFLQHFWPLRTLLWNRNDFSKQTYKEVGRTFWEYHQIPKEKYATPLSISFPFVASHNHFVLDRGGSVFNRSAPLVKLQKDATEDDHLALLGLLNSSVFCFLMKQVSHQKQLTGGDGVRVQSRAKVPYEFAGTQLLRISIPKGFREGRLRDRILEIARLLESKGKQISDLSAYQVIGRSLAANIDIDKAFAESETEKELLRSQMILLQEELDFTAYALYGLVDDSLLSSESEWKGVSVDAGMRPFEIRHGKNVDGFDTPTEIPVEWPDKLREMWQKRLSAIKTNAHLRLLEDDHYKRRWIGRQGLFNLTAQQNELGTECKRWLLERLASEPYWQGEPQLKSTSRIADIAGADKAFRAVASVYRQREDFDLKKLVDDLVGAESVPLLPALTYKPSGLRKRLVWEQVWEQQRKEDRGEGIGEIKSPPKYSNTDFMKPDYSRLRGRLGVPKERFVSFPNCHTEGDPSLVVGWAGWTHLQQGTAIASYYDARKREGWSAERLTPLLAALDQLLPWIHQWHPEIDPEYNETAGTSFQTLLESEAQELGLTLEQIRNWTPPAKKRAKKKKAVSKPRKKSKSAEATEGE